MRRSILTLSLLLLSLNLLLLADRALQKRPESMTVTLLDLTQGSRKQAPPGHIGAENTHAEWVRIVSGITDPSNPFGASDPALTRARQLAKDLRATTRRMMWLQFGLLENLQPNDEQAYMTVLFDHSLDATRDDPQSLREALDRALGSEQAPLEPVPQQWEPALESPVRQARWKTFMDGPTSGRHLFLYDANRGMVLWLTRQPALARSPKKAGRARQLAQQLLSTCDETAQIRATLLLLVRTMPSYTPGEAVRPGSPDASLLDVYAVMPR